MADVALGILMITVMVAAASGLRTIWKLIARDDRHDIW